MQGDFSCVSIYANVFSGFHVVSSPARTSSWSELEVFTSVDIREVSEESVCQFFDPTWEIYKCKSRAELLSYSSEDYNRSRWPVLQLTQERCCLNVMYNIRKQLQQLKMSVMTAFWSWIVVLSIDRYLCTEGCWYSDSDAWSAPLQCNRFMEVFFGPAIAIHRMRPCLTLWTWGIICLLCGVARASQKMPIKANLICSSWHI